MNPKIKRSTIGIALAIVFFMGCTVLPINANFFMPGPDSEIRSGGSGGPSYVRATRVWEITLASYFHEKYESGLYKTKASDFSYTITLTEKHNTRNGLYYIYYKFVLHAWMSKATVDSQGGPNEWNPFLHYPYGIQYLKGTAFLNLPNAAVYYETYSKFYHFIFRYEEWGAYESSEWMGLKFDCNNVNGGIITRVGAKTQNDYWPADITSIRGIVENFEMEQGFVYFNNNYLLYHKYICGFSWWNGFCSVELPTYAWFYGGWVEDYVLDWTGNNNYDLGV